MLYRWAAATTGKQAVSKAITRADLAALTELAAEHSTQLYDLRLSERS